MKDAINFTVFLFGILIALIWAWLKFVVWFCCLVERVVVWVFKRYGEERISGMKNIKRYE